LRYTIKITTEEFLYAIARLSPVHNKKLPRSGVVDIGLHQGSVIFSTAGSKMRCVAIEANWPGYASVKKAILFSFLKVRPTTDILEISYENGRLTIERFGVAALWAETPEWITEMSTNARFIGESEEIYAEIRNCNLPQRCKSLWSDLLTTPDPSIRQCNLCDTNVYLCETATILQKFIAANNTVAIPIKRIKKRR
jgi:hypothetical protein